MSEKQQPVVLELAPLPREQIGPFLLLGVEKSADAEQVEAHWAQRVIWARKKQIDVALEEINWAREVLRDPERRVLADLTSLNADTADATLARLRQHYGAIGPTWKPLEIERRLQEYGPTVEVPEVRDLLPPVPDVPREAPAVAALLDQFLSQPLDPWALALPSDPEQDDLA